MLASGRAFGHQKYMPEPNYVAISYKIGTAAHAHIYIYMYNLTDGLFVLLNAIGIFIEECVFQALGLYNEMVMYMITYTLCISIYQTDCRYRPSATSLIRDDFDTCGRKLMIFGYDILVRIGNEILKGTEDSQWYSNVV